MKNFMKSDGVVLKHHFEKKILELEEEKNALQVLSFRIIVGIGTVVPVKAFMHKDWHTCHAYKLQTERDMLVSQLTRLANTSDEQSHKLHETYVQKVKALETQVLEVI